jgi:cysteine desulfurase
LGGIHLNGSQKNRVAGNLSISFENIDGEELLVNLCQKIAISTGSACATGIANQSHVLSELGLSSELSQATIRIGLGRFNTKTEMDIAANLIKEEVLRQRGAS